MPDRRPAGSGERETRTTPTRAQPMPIITPIAGNPWRANPTPTGRIAAITAVTGATTPILPTPMPSTGARRPVQPPPKSPAPHATAEARPSATVASAGPSGSAVGRSGCDRYRGAVVLLGRPHEGDDGVGGRVVPIRGRQVDDLEVPRDLAK